MSREELAASLAVAEAELHAAQREYDGSLRAIERYRQARAAHKQVERLARLVVSEKPT